MLQIMIVDQRIFRAKHGEKNKNCTKK